MDFQERKKLRTEWFFKYAFKNKMKVCVACSGSGYYDSTNKWGRVPKCYSCSGTGKVHSRTFIKFPFKNCYF